MGVYGTHFYLDGNSPPTAVDKISSDAMFTTVYWQGKEEGVPFGNGEVLMFHFAHVRRWYCLCRGSAHG